MIVVVSSIVLIFVTDQEAEFCNLGHALRREAFVLLVIKDVLTLLYSDCLASVFIWMY